jgi:hypothetical protein
VTDFQNQHIIPQVYLRRWAAPNLGPGRTGQVWVIQKDDLTKKELKSTKGIFSKPDHYTLWNGAERDLRVEEALSIIERDLPKVYAKLDKREPITGAERVFLTFFTAGMLSRVQSQANWMAESLYTEWYQTARLEEKENIEPVASANIEREMGNLNGEVVRAGLMRRAKMLWGMGLYILTTEDETGFITGDDPCSMAVRDGGRVYIGNPTVEIILPLTPRHAAVFAGPPSLSRLGCPGIYRQLSADLVEECNLRTMAQCDKEFVSLRGEVRDSWFMPEAA